MTEKPRIIDGTRGLAALVGNELGASPWQVIDQGTIDKFGRVTGDEQWIHVDPDRAANGPYGTTIAHGFLLLSLIPRLAEHVYKVQGFAARINYGMEKVRFPRPVHSGERIRDRMVLVKLEHTPTGVRATFNHQIEVEDADRPACVAQTVTLFIP